MAPSSNRSQRDRGSCNNAADPSPVIIAVYERRNGNSGDSPDSVIHRSALPAGCSDGRAYSSADSMGAPFMTLTLLVTSCTIAAVTHLASLAPRPLLVSVEPAGAPQSPGTPGTGCGPSGAECTWQPRARIPNQAHPCRRDAISSCSAPSGAAAPCGFCYGPFTVTGVWYSHEQEGEFVVCAHPKGYSNCTDLHAPSGSTWTSNRRYICQEPEGPDAGCSCDPPLAPDSSPTCGPALPAPIFRGC